MSFSAYLIQPFSHTHENEFFRDIVKELKSKFANSEEKVVLIGNIFCNGHELDAIFIKSGQITILEFKNYTGKLEFSENNPWKIYNENKFVFVKGGSFLNPFQQVKAYRYSLIDFFRNFNDKIILNENKKKKWEYIHTIIAFSDFIEFDKYSISPNIRKYFHISGKIELIDLLMDINSPDLSFTDGEIDRILKVLDVRPENLYNETFLPESKKKTDERLNLKLIEKLLPEKKENSESWKIFNFYRTLINLERYKELQLKKADLYKYKIFWSGITDKLTIDLTANSIFYNLFIENMVQQFPKNLFVGINVLFNGKEIPLFYSLILNSELEKKQKSITIEIKDFELNKEILEQFEPGEELVENLASKVEQESFLKDKILIVEDLLGVSVNLTDSVSIGLSETSNYTAQLLSELKTLSKIYTDNGEKKIFESFLYNSEISPDSRKLDSNNFIKITPLNSSQEQALYASFQQPLTVVTGPPGTGKSQLVVNLIANAIINNKSILFASKNNKAVDTVKERVNKILTENYLLRFGSKSEIRNNTKVVLEKFINKSKQYQLVDKSNVLEDFKEKIDQINYKKSEIKLKLHEIDVIEKNVEKLNNIVDDLTIEYNKFLSHLNKIYYEILIEKKYVININAGEILNLLKNVEFYNSNFFTRFIFWLFSKDKIINEIKLIHEKLNENVSYFILNKMPYIKKEKSILESLLDHLEFFYDFLKEFENIKEQNDSRLKEISTFKEKLKSENEKLELLLPEKPKLLEKLENLENTFVQVGKEYLNVVIHEKIRNMNIDEVRKYLEFIPDNIPWKKELIKGYENRCKNFLKDFYAVSITNLSIKNAFPLAKEIFDILVIDEASQCDIVSALPLLYRAKSVVIIGDPLQLKHITNVKKNEQEYIAEYFEVGKYNFNYVENSLFDFSRVIADKSKLDTFFLQEHYRCHPEIIKFSNENYYNLRLGQIMEIKTKPENFKYGDRGIYWYNVTGQVYAETNINIQEAKFALQLAEKLVKKYPDASIGIVTPFRHQSEFLKSNVKNVLKEKVQIDTVHKYQGDEKDIIILSLVVAPGSRPSLTKFINYKSSYLLNVAVTRARSSLYIVGDFNYCKNLTDAQGFSYLKKLAEYVDSLGNVFLD